MTIEIGDIKMMIMRAMRAGKLALATGNDEFDNDHIMISDGNLLKIIKQSCPVSLAVK